MRFSVLQSYFTQNRLVLTLALFGLFFTQTLSAQHFEGRPLATPQSVIDQYFYQADVFHIDAALMKNWLLQQPGRSGEMHLNLGEKYRFDLNIAPSNLVKPGTMVAIGGDNGVIEVPFEYDPTYRGAQINGNGVFALVINDQHIEGAIMDRGQVLNIQPLRLYDPKAEPDDYIVYSNSDIRPGAPTYCGTADAEKKVIELHETHDRDQNTDDPESLLLACYQVDLAVATANNMLTPHGGSIIGVQNHVLAVLDLVNVLYAGTFTHDINFVVTDWYNSTTAAGNSWGQSTNSGTLLNNFTAWGQAGNFGSTYDLAELWDHTTWQNGVVGIAWLSAVCTNNRYHAISDFTTNMCLLQVTTAHEIGHNFSCTHDAAGSPTIMAPSVQCTDNWSGMSVNQVNAYLPGRINANCLTACAGSAPPVANFSFSPTSPVCQGQEVQFTDLSTGTPTTWNWLFPSGTPATSTEQNPIVIWNTPGTFSVKLTASNAAGSSMITKTIVVNPLPTANFTFTKNLLTVTFNATSSTNGISYAWDFGDGNTSTVQNPIHTYAMDGFYLVTLFVTNACGTVEITKEVEIVTPPVANFAASPVNGCAPQAVFFENLSSLNATNFQWTMPGAFPPSSTAFSPTVVYNNPGTYSVTLTATNAAGSDTEIKLNYVVVGAEPEPSFFTTVNLNVVNFTNTTPGSGNTYLWNFGDGQTSTEISPTHTYAASGTYTVTLTATNVCGVITETQTVVIVLLPTANFTANPTTGCAPMTVNFTNSSTGATSYLWTFTGGTPASSTDQNPTVVYNTAGLFSVKLKVCNATGCDSLTKTDFITVGTTPTASFTSVTSGSTVNFTNTSTGATSYLWNFGDGQTSTVVSPSHTYSADGNYSVTLTATNACGSVTSVQSISIVTPVAAGFNNSNPVGCEGLVVNYTNISTPNVTNWAWTFAGGTPATSNLPNPVVTYLTAGTYGVTLTVSNSQFSNTITMNNLVVISPLPTAGFTASSAGNTVTFTNTSTNATSYLWEFSDNTTSTEVSPVHTFAADGNYTAVLTATNACGTNSVTQTISLNTPPTAVFSASPAVGCEPMNVQFTSQSSANSSSFSWSFPGGAPPTSSVQNPNVTYSLPGTYTASLTVTNAAGSSSTTMNVIVNPVATAGFTSSQNGLSVNFTNTSTNATSYSWQFGDGQTSTEQNPSHTYLNDGNYTVILTATNDCGPVTSTQNLVIATPPTAVFSASQTSGCGPFTVNFTNQSSANSSSFAWTFPGGNPASSIEQNPSVTYSTPGVYLASLTVTNSAGSSTSETTITVLGVPTAGFSNQINGLSANFTNNSTGATTYSWDFGDSQTSTEQNPSHIYANDGSYTVVLTATNGCGVTQSTQTIVVATPPTANFSASQTEGCGPMVVNFTNQSSANSSSFAWAFPGGNPATSTEQNPSVTYSTAGIFTATLTVTNAAGSANSSTTITVNASPTAGFSSQTTGLTTAFSNSSTDATTYQWTFGDGEISNEQNPTHIYAGDGTYTVVLTSTNGCGSDVSTQTVVIVTPPTAAFSASQNSGCAPVAIGFLNGSSANSTSFNWSFPGGSPASSTDENPSVTYSLPGTYDAFLTVTNAAGSSTTSQLQIIQIGLAPTAAFTTAPAGLSIVFTNNSTGSGNEYIWDFGDASFGSTEENPTHTYAAVGTYLATLTVNNDCGTANFTQEIIVAGSAPLPDFTSTTTDGCVPLEVNFADNSVGNPTTWAWTFPGGFPGSSNIANPIVTYSTPGTYDVTLEVTNAFGKNSKTFTQVVEVAEPPIVGFVYTNGPGYSVSFNNLTGNADAFAWNFGDGGSSTEQNPTHIYAGNGTYTVVLTATNVCASNSVQQTVSISSGSTEADWLSKFLIYPNPTSSDLTIELAGIPGGEMQVSVLDILGREILAGKNFDFSTGSLKESIDLSSLPSASYIVRLQNAGQIAYVKIAVQH